MKRGVLILTLGILLVASTLFAQTLTVRVPLGNVRSGPGTTYDIVGTVKRGEKYRANASQGDWFKVLLETGQEGWVFKSLVDLSGKRTIGVVPSAAPKSAVRPYGNSWAIVIGINQYRKPTLRLHYAVNDARSVTQALQQIGFPEKNIITLLDGQATGSAIRKAFGRLTRRTKANDRVVVFFAGHGVTDSLPGGGEMGYLIPVEGDPNDLVGTGLPMSQVRDMSRSLPAKHVFFAIDACYSGLMAFRVAPKPDTKIDVGRLTRKRLRQILTAGERDQPVGEEGGFGIFTKRFVDGLSGDADFNPRDGIITANELAAWIYPRVVTASNNQQTPFFGTMEGVGQFVFIAPGLGRGMASAPPSAPVPTTPRPPPLPPVALLPKGDLYVSSEPPGAKIFLDGRDTGKQTPVFLEGVATGSRRVEVRKGDYMVASASVSVLPNAINRLKLKLEVLQGRLKVVSEPLEADVFVDGKKVGKTPLIASVPGGSRTVRVVKRGYKAFEKRIDISTRQTNRLLAVLGEWKFSTEIVPARISKAGVLNIGVVPYATDVIKDPNTGQYKGVMVDAAKFICERMKVKCVFKEFFWATFIAGLQSRQIDLSIASSYAKNPRALIVNFSRPIYLLGYKGVARKGDNRFKTPEDLNNSNITIGVTQGTGEMEWVRKVAPKARLRVVKTEEMNMLQIVTGKVDISVGDSIAANHALASQPGIQPALGGRIYSKNMVAWSVNKADLDILNFVNTALNQLIASGKLLELAKKYKAPWMNDLAY